MEMLAIEIEKQMGKGKYKKLQWISKEIHKTYQIVKLIILLWLI